MAVVRRPGSLGASGLGAVAPSLVKKENQPGEAAGGGACRLFPILVFIFTRLLLVGNNIIIHSLQKKNIPLGVKVEFLLIRGG